MSEEIKKDFFGFVMIGVVFLIGFFLLSHFSEGLRPENFKNIKSIEIAGQNVKVELAPTAEERTRGLSGRVGLEENGGMLFVFDSDGVYPFWMKDMNFPIDIVWINKDLKVVYVKENATPDSFPESFSSGEKVLYVLEVSAGFSEKNNLQIGDEVVFTQ